MSCLMSSLGGVGGRAGLYLFADMVDSLCRPFLGSKSVSVVRFH